MSNKTTGLGIGAWPPMQRLQQSIRGSGLFEAGLVTVARAPGRLDVMGGIADYTGSLVCEMPLAVAAGVAGQRRSDAMIVCRSEQARATVQAPVAAVVGHDASAVRRQIDEQNAWARYVIGCYWWLGQHAQRAGAWPGVTLLVDSDVPLGAGVSSSAAIEVATMMTLCELLGVKLSPMQLAAACQSVENRVVGAPCGVMDQVTSAMGEPGSMIEILCQSDETGLPAQVRSRVPVPEGFTFVGVNSGVKHEVRGDPYTDTRVAAFIGQKLLWTIEPALARKGHLANIDAVYYRHRLRDQLPEVIQGQAFLDEYAATDDPVTTVQPQKQYRVRSAVDHHVYEMARVQDFVALLRGEIQSETALLTRMRRAGWLMFESHRSYSRCANLGHPLTDSLVGLVQLAGFESGVLGAKITGGGCGGTVAILIQDEPRAREQVERIRAQYTLESGRPTTLFEESSPGATVLGTQSLVYDGGA